MHEHATTRNIFGKAHIIATLFMDSKNEKSLQMETENSRMILMGEHQVEADVKITFSGQSAPF